MAKRLDAGQVSKNNVVLQGFRIIRDFWRSLVLPLLKEQLGSKLGQIVQGCVLLSLESLCGWRLRQHLWATVLIQSHFSQVFSLYFQSELPLLHWNDSHLCFFLLRAFEKGASIFFVTPCTQNSLASGRLLLDPSLVLRFSRLSKLRSSSLSYVMCPYPQWLWTVSSLSASLSYCVGPETGHCTDVISQVLNRGE